MIPNELKQLKQWVVWDKCADKFEPNKFRKVPVNAMTGTGAKSNDPSTWCDYQTALDASKFHSGIGFMFANGYFGIDIDGIENELEEYRSGADNIVSEFVETMQSYAEYSQSGKGLHIICRGSLPEGGRRKGNVEMYESGRFFIMTGNKIGDYDITDGTEAVKHLHAKYIGTKARENVLRTTANYVLDMSDEEVLEKAFNSRGGQSLRALYDGDYSIFGGDHSAADQALCNKLAFWFGKDKSRMDSVFRSSGLMRDKWDEMRGAKTYGSMTLDRAISDCTDVWNPRNDDGYSVSIDFSKKKPESKKKFYSWDEIGNAELFADTLRDSVMYNYTQKKWMFWDGKRWASDSEGMITRLSIDIINKLEDDYGENAREMDAKSWSRHMKRSRSRAGLLNMVDIAKGFMATNNGEFDNNPMILNTQSGIVNLENGELTDFDRNVMVSKIANSEYTTKSTPDIWLKLLSDAFDNDSSMIRWFQKWCGYCLTGSTEEQLIVFCVGNGRNGKSTILDTISEILGDYAGNMQSESLMHSKSGNRSSTGDIARLNGLRFVTVSESDEGERLNESLIKQLTGGDKVTASKKYENEFEFHSVAKIQMATNHKPNIRGTDDGIWRRIRIIPFDVQIPEERVDKSLKYKLRKEYSAILGWMVEGCIAWRHEGLGQVPLKMQSAASEYKGEMDVVKQFIDENITEQPGAKVQANIVYSAYRQWAKENNMYEMTGTKFGREFTKRYGKKREPAGIFYVGIKMSSRHQFTVNY